MHFRWASYRDYTALGEVMFDAVRNGESLYDERQRAAWVPKPRSDKTWNDRLGRQSIVVAEKEHGIVGFMSLAEGGYIDFAYIRPEERRRGLFRLLFERVQTHAMERGEKALSVHASLMAAPAFSAMGFAVVRREHVKLGGVILERFQMEKSL